MLEGNEIIISNDRGTYDSLYCFTLQINASEHDVYEVWQTVESFAYINSLLQYHCDPKRSRISLVFRKTQLESQEVQKEVRSCYQLIVDWLSMCNISISDVQVIDDTVLVPDHNPFDESVNMLSQNQIIFATVISTSPKFRDRQIQSIEITIPIQYKRVIENFKKYYSKNLEDVVGGFRKNNLWVGSTSGLGYFKESDRLFTFHALFANPKIKPRIVESAVTNFIQSINADTKAPFNYRLAAIATPMSYK